MMAATEGVLRLQMKSKSSMPCTARGCMPLLPSVPWHTPAKGYLETYYTKHRVLLWKRVCSRGVRTRLGGSKRRMLSLAEMLPLAAVARGGAADGMVVDVSVQTGGVSRRIEGHGDG